MIQRPLSPAAIGVGVAVTFVVTVAVLAVVGAVTLHGSVLEFKPIDFQFNIQLGKWAR
ncbi:MAG: hypothetical protein JF588_17810 [Caulobacterales bacterium]|nr:hypothetical protein [Caulobacterales bacterium]